MQFLLLPLLLVMSYSLLSCSVSYPVLALPHSLLLHLRLGTFPHIKAELDKPVEGKDP